MGLKPLFTAATIARQIKEFAEKHEDDFIAALSYIGEEFVNQARSVRTYQDITGNLRASIGYAIIKNGKAIQFKVSRAATEGKIAAADFVNQKISEFSKEGIYLLVFAGMEYALYVEASGYDVLSGSRPSKAEIRNFFKDLLK